MVAVGLGTAKTTARVEVELRGADGGLGSGVLDGVSVGVRLGVSVSVGVGDAVMVGVSVGVSVGVCVAVWLGVGVQVFVGAGGRGVSVGQTYSKQQPMQSGGLPHGSQKIHFPMELLQPEQGQGRQ